MIARVFVPLVGANGESAQVFEAIAGDIAPEAHPARLLPQKKKGMHRLNRLTEC